MIPPERNKPVTTSGICFALVTDPVFGRSPGSGHLGGASTLVFNDVMLILATGCILALLLMLWARYGRSRRPGSSAPAPAMVWFGGGNRRRRRRAPLPRNPTRAETGGLPPIRVDGPIHPSP